MWTLLNSVYNHSISLYETDTRPKQTQLGHRSGGISKKLCVTNALLTAASWGRLPWATPPEHNKIGGAMDHAQSFGKSVLCPYHVRSFIHNKSISSSCLSRAYFHTRTNALSCLLVGTMYRGSAHPFNPPGTLARGFHLETCQAFSGTNVG